MNEKIKLLKDWWWVAGIVVGGILVWGNLPTRMAKAEEQLEDLKGWAREIQGYTRAMQQQMPNQPASSDRPQFFEEQGEDGRWWCCTAYDRQDCFRDDLWRLCE